jgi:hypothetical protein
MSSPSEIALGPHLEKGYNAPEEDTSSELHDSKSASSGGSLLKPDGSYSNHTYDPNLDLNPQVQPDPEQSRYPEVSCAVSNKDDPNIPCNTVRVWIIGLAWTILISGVNQCVSLTVGHSKPHIIEF